MLYKKTEKVRLVCDGYERNYEFYVSANFDPAQTHPMVIVLQGGGVKAKGIIWGTRGRFNTLADKGGFIVTYPNGWLEIPIAALTGVTKSGVFLNR